MRERRPSRAPRKRVCFSGTDRVVLIPARSDYDEATHKELWWSLPDYEHFKYTAYRDLQAGKLYSDDPAEEEPAQDAHAPAPGKGEGVAAGHGAEGKEEAPAPQPQPQPAFLEHVAEGTDGNPDPLYPYLSHDSHSRKAYHRNGGVPMAGVPGTEGGGAVSGQGIDWVDAGEVASQAGSQGHACEARGGDMDMVPSQMVAGPVASEGDGGAKITVQVHLTVGPIEGLAASISAM
jgi:hypothetical protein